MQASHSLILLAQGVQSAGFRNRNQLLCRACSNHAFAEAEGWYSGCSVVPEPGSQHGSPSLETSTVSGVEGGKMHHLFFPTMHAFQNIVEFGS